MLWGKEQDISTTPKKWAVGVGKREYIFREVCLLLLFLLAAAGLSACTETHPPTYDTHINDSLANYDAAACFEEDGSHINNRFSSDLPVVVLDLQDQEMEYGSVSTIQAQLVDDATQGLATIKRSPSEEVALALVQHRDSLERQKQDYYFYFEDRIAREVFGTDESVSWVLLGGQYDKSLIRNFVGYTFAGLVIDEVPEPRFCEVLLRDEEGYQYQGVYVLVAVDIPDNCLAIQHRDEYPPDPSTIVADNTLGIFVVQGPRSSYDNYEASLEAATKAFYTFESTILSDDTNYFLQYKQLINSEEFSAWFLVHELLGNYERMDSFTYLYDTQANTISLYPFLNFEKSLDNDASTAANLRRLQFQNAPLFEFLVLDSAFIDTLIATSKNNYQYFNNQTLNQIADRAVLELGTAQERDWYRWDSLYNSSLYNMKPGEVSSGNFYETSDGLYDEEGQLVIEAESQSDSLVTFPLVTRTTNTYEEELTRIKYYFDVRPFNVKRALPVFRNQEDLLSQANAYWQNTVVASGFLAVLALSIIIARRKVLR